MRIAQPVGERGSLRWIQRAVARHAPALEAPILDHVGAREIEWRSPLSSDAFAEYRDGAFLERVGIGHLRSALADFWPARGPQWDALGITDQGDVLLVEAKAHVRELCSPGSQASEASRARIAARLEETARALGARPGHADWIEHFYQLANRLAHLWFLRENGVRAWLVLVNFVGDSDMAGPISDREWLAAYRIAWHVMGLGARHPLAPFLVETFPSVEGLS
ncbi:MAG: hypothetical protein ACOY45_04895 [Pseudomonadota bacterium]